MANFCGKCGTKLDIEFGLCPNCNKDELETAYKKKNTPKFCTVCGSNIDQETGLCPKCTQNVISEEQNANDEMVDLISAQHNQQVQITPPPVDQDIKPKKNKGKALTTVITILLCFMISIFSILSVTILSIRQATTEDAIENILEDVSFTELMDMSSDPDSKNENTNDIFNSFKEYLIKRANVTITKKQFNNFIEDSDIKEFITEKISDYAESFYSGDDEFSLTRREVYELLEDNFSLIQREFGPKVTYEVLDDISKWLVKDSEIEKITVEGLKENYATPYYIVNIGLSYITFAVLLILIALLIFAMIKNNLSQGLLGTGIVFTSIGAGFSIIAFIFMCLPVLWNSISGNAIVGFVLGKVFSINIVNYCVILVVGILLLVIRKLVMNYISKSKTREAQANIQ